MEDKQIVDLFWQRSEAAIVAAASKYGKYCSKIAYDNRPEALFAVTGAAPA